MYQRDCKEIEHHALSNPAGLVDVIEFTLCSIQAGSKNVERKKNEIHAKTN